jgi:4-hydroxy-tetrahydrodipicolinate synthase
MELCNALFSEVNPIPVKKALSLMGMIGGTLRRPLTEMEPANVQRLEKAMRGYGLL